MTSQMECSHEHSEDELSSNLGGEENFLLKEPLLPLELLPHSPKLDYLSPINAAPLAMGVSPNEPSSSQVHEQNYEERNSVVRDLFGDKKKREIAHVDSHIEKKAVIPFRGGLSCYVPPLINISQISDTKLRFAIEGRILNKYGTYKSDQDFKKYLKVDLVDRECLHTITLVVSEPYISQYVGKLDPDIYIRVEGGVVQAKNSSDGGSSMFALHVDATTSIIKAEPFDCALVFMPEISIQRFLAKSINDPSLKGTISFVVLQVDSIKKKSGSIFAQLTIADGPSMTDRATLSIVNGRRPVLNALVEEFESGNIVMYVARNVGIWKDRSNTLSILDITVLTPVYGERLKASLQNAFRTQIHDMGYGQEIVGTFTITNFNDALVAKKCALCKETKLNQIPEGTLCFVCGKVVEIVLVPCIEGSITQEHSGIVRDVKLAASIVDKVLQLEDKFLNLYHKNAIMLKIALSDVEIFGKFFVDKRGQIISFTHA